MSQNNFAINKAFAEKDNDKHGGKSENLSNLTDEKLIKKFQRQVTTLEEMGKIVDETSLVDVTSQKLISLKNKIVQNIDDKNIKSNLTKDIDKILTHLKKANNLVDKSDEKELNKLLKITDNSISDFAHSVGSKNNKKIPAGLANELINDALEISSDLKKRDKDVIPVIQHYDLPLTQSLIDRSAIELDMLRDIFAELESRGVEIEIVVERNSPVSSEPNSSVGIAAKIPNPDQVITKIKIKGITTVLDAALHSWATTKAVSQALFDSGQPRLNSYEIAGLFLINASAYASLDLFIPVPEQVDDFALSLTNLVVGSINESKFVSDVYVPILPALLESLLIPIEVEAILSIRNDLLVPILTVITEVINDNGGSLFPGNFIVNMIGVNPHPNSFNGVNGSGVKVALDVGEYNAIQVPISGYDSHYTNDCSSDVNGPIQAGQKRTCVISNNDVIFTPQPITVEFTSVGAEDGYLTMTGPSCANGPILGVSKNGVTVAMGPRLWNPNISAASCNRAWASWDVSSIPDGAQIIDTTFTYHALIVNTVGFPNAPRAGTIYSLENNPVDADPTTLRTDIRNGIQYVVNDPSFNELGIHTIDLGPLADAELESNLDNGWFGIGISHPDEATSVFKDMQFAASEDTSGNIVPTLSVTYIPPITPPPSNLFFQDDYSSNAGWTQSGSTITVNSPSFPGVVKFNNAFGGGAVNDQRVYKQLPSALPADNWIAELDYKFTASSLVAHYPLAFTTSSNNPETQPNPSADVVRIYHGVATNQIHISGGSGSADIPISPNTQYYLQLKRTPTQLILSAFSDPARTIHVTGSPVSSNILATDYANLNYIQHSNSFASGPARTLTAEVDNTKIFAP